MKACCVVVAAGILECAIICLAGAATGIALGALIIATTYPPSEEVSYVMMVASNFDYAEVVYGVGCCFCALLLNFLWKSLSEYVYGT